MYQFPSFDRIVLPVHPAWSCGRPGWWGNSESVAMPVAFAEKSLWCAQTEFPAVPEYPEQAA